MEVWIGMSIVWSVEVSTNREILVQNIFFFFCFYCNSGIRCLWSYFLSLIWTEFFSHIAVKRNLDLQKYPVCQKQTFFWRKPHWFQLHANGVAASGSSNVNMYLFRDRLLFSGCTPEYQVCRICEMCDLVLSLGKKKKKVEKQRVTKSSVPVRVSKKYHLAMKTARNSGKS